MGFGVGICRSWRSLTVVVCIVPLIHVEIIMGDSTIHCSGMEWVENGVFIKFWLVASAWNLSLH